MTFFYDEVMALGKCGEHTQFDDLRGFGRSPRAEVRGHLLGFWHTDYVPAFVGGLCVISPAELALAVGERRALFNYGFLDLGGCIADYGDRAGVGKIANAVLEDCAPGEARRYNAGVL